MFELLIGIDGVQRRMGKRGEKIHRERPSRLRSAFSAAWGGAGSAAPGRSHGAPSPRRDPLPLTETS